MGMAETKEEAQCICYDNFGSNKLHVCVCAAHVGWVLITNMENGKGMDMYVTNRSHTLQ